MHKGSLKHNYSFFLKSNYTFNLGLNSVRIIEINVVTNKKLTVLLACRCFISNLYVLDKKRVFFCNVICNDM